MKSKLILAAIFSLCASYLMADTGYNQTTKVVGSSSTLNATVYPASTVAFNVNGSTVGVVQVGSPWGATQTPGTSGGLVVFSTNSVINSTQTVKGSAGQVYGWNIYNGNAAIRWLHFYNNTNVSMGTTSDVFAIAIPPTSIVQGGSVSGISFSSAIGIAATNGNGPTDNTAPSVNDVQAVIFYK